VSRRRRAAGVVVVLALWLAAAVAAQPAAATLAAGDLGRTGGTHRAQGVIIEDQGFESTVFPPPGWIVVDQMYDPPEYQWSRETCRVESPGGGGAAAWSVGGGAGGSGLACGTPYTQAVDTFLVYGPIDTRSFPGGIRVSMRVWLDMPRTDSFIVCATHGPGVSDYSCYDTGATQSDWDRFAPLDFPLTAGRTDVDVWINYRDRLPPGGHVGVFIDNVRIEGMGQAETPTTPAAGPSPTGTQTVPTLTPATGTSTGTATTEPGASPSPSPTPTMTTQPPVTGTATVTAETTPAATPTGQTPSTPALTPEATATAATPATPGATETAHASPTADPTLEPSPTAAETAEATETAQAEPSPTPEDAGARIFLPLVNRLR